MQGRILVNSALDSEGSGKLLSAFSLLQNLFELNVGIMCETGKKIQSFYRSGMEIRLVKRSSGRLQSEP